MPSPVLARVPRPRAGPRRAPFAIAAALAALVAVAMPARARAQQPVSRAYAAAPDGSVRVFLLTGRVRVVGGAADSVVVSGTVPDARAFHGGGDGRSVKLGVWDEGIGAAAVAAPSDLTVRVPRRARVWVKAAQDATVEVSGVTGGLDLNIVSGVVRVRGAPRELNVEAMDGRVEVDGAPAWLRAKTAGGAIVLAGSAEDVALTSVSGAIRATLARVTRGRFETVTGDITFDGAPERGGALTFDTHGGAVRVALPPTAPLDVDVTTILGAIDNRLTAARPVADENGRGRELGFATEGSPATRVTVRSFRGRVEISARAPR